MLNSLVLDVLGAIDQAYNPQENQNTVTVHVLDPRLIEYLLDDVDAPTKYNVVFDPIDKEQIDKERNDVTSEKLLMFSGGPDSLIAWYYLGKPPAMFVNLHYFYNDLELQTVKKIAEKTGMDLRIFDCNIMKFYREGWGDTIPLRNLLLAAIGSYFANNIYIISQKGETYIKDRTARFFYWCSKMLSEFYGKSITVTTPFFHMTKGEMIRWALDNGVPKDILLMTRSCFSTQTGHCGECSACIRRAVAFTINGVLDVFNDYLKIPFDIQSKYYQHYIPKMVDCLKNGEFERYDRTRCLETLAALIMYRQLQGKKLNI